MSDIRGVTLGQPLTDAQLSHVTAIRDHWIRVGLSTERCDRLKAEHLVKSAYRVAGLDEPPIVVWMDSPLGGVLASAMIRNLSEKGQLENQLWGQLGGQLRGQLWDQLWGQLRDQLWGQLRGQLRGQLGGQLGGQLRDQLWGQLGDQLWGQLRGAELVAEAPDPGNDPHTIRLYELPAVLEEAYSEPARIALVTNGSVERDGTRHRYGIVVRKSFSDPIAAMADTYGVPAHVYKQLQVRR
ncbi:MULTISPECIES: hypothetical protein [unclassified Gordonia (in: high G+C Gram-positive bacteria)]|uniref:hypothetical protein n=1 Tax=unclassified Gordonia (in: high G+C Gram-positive bacteria) TaxID=2657482 RepID=UPI000A821B15|nr:MULTISPECIES: hypothetical protein [unclassified Gordonia (in: high G+C Gram-positive bacteria)]